MGRKWNNIKEGKAKNDAGRSKIYSKFGREILVAAKNGDPDPEINRNLRAVIDRAKTYKVPREIIERAIEKAKGGTSENYIHNRYEGYGVGGSAIIVDTLTDNVNRTVAEVRTAFNKNNGNIGVSGSVAFMFEPTALFGVAKMDEEQLLEMLLENDCDCRDIETEDEITYIYANIDQFAKVSEALKANGINEFEIAELTDLPKNEVTLPKDDWDTFEKLIEALENLDDVQNVYHNVNND